nr:hypothetical protein [Tanacetum cinerariifolium]
MSPGIQLFTKSRSEFTEVMVIDKSWTSLGKHEKAFYTGLKKFIDDCKPLADNHISKYGFDPSYKTWIHHGEVDLPPPQSVIDNTRQLQMSDMTACLNELSYIPLNNEQNEPTQGDIAKFTYFKAKDVHFCPVCNTSRWKDSNTPGKKVPKKVLRYFLIISRLQRLYKSSHTAKEMTWHATGNCTKPEPRNVRLGLAADGFNPFDNLSQSYSMWPNVLESILNTLLMNDKSKDTTKARQDLKRLGIQSGLWLGQNKNKKCSKPQAAYSFTAEDRKNLCKPEGSIAKGYVAEEALTFSSYYFRDVTMKFNCPDRNLDCPPLTCQLQVFKSLCKSIGLRSVIRIGHQELKKVIWYVLHNSREIDTYRAKFKIEFPNKDMKEEFPGRFGKQIRQRHVDNDLGVNESSELFALACGPSQTPILANSCVVNGVRFVVHSRDERRTTQNSGICSPGLDGEMYYGQLEQILEFSYLSFKTVLFRVKWFDTSNKGPQVKQCFYLEDMARRPQDGQSIDVDAPPDIIDIVDEDDDIIDEEDPIPHDLADSGDEDLVNLNIDDGMSADVARGHGGDGGGDDRPPPYQVPTGCGGCLGNRG